MHGEANPTSSGTKEEGEYFLILGAETRNQNLKVGSLSRLLADSRMAHFYQEKGKRSN